MRSGALLAQRDGSGSVVCLDVDFMNFECLVHPLGGVGECQLIISRDAVRKFNIHGMIILSLMLISCFH